MLRVSQLLRFLILIFTLVAVIPAPSYAQTEGIGIRAGVSANPDQFYFGVHVLTKPVVEKLRFRPNAEIGFGSHTTTVALNGEFVYSVPLRREPWSLYLGAGPAINFYTAGESPSRNTSVKPGFNFLLGLEHREWLFTEIKVGAIDSPSFKFGIGYNFH